MSDVMTSQTGGSDGFWSVVSRGLSEGISRVGSDLVPRWAEQQVFRQSTDQLNNTTANNAGAGRIDDGLQSTSQTAASNVSVAGVDLNKTSLIIAGAAFVIIFVLLIFRR